MWYNRKRKRKEITSVKSEAAKAARRAYMKEWRARNKDKVRAMNERYWQRRAARESAEAGAGGISGAAETEARA